MQDTAPRATTRTWNTVTHDRMDGAIIQTREHTVTLTRTAAGIEAVVDGQPCELRRAVNILRSATTTTVTHEILKMRASKPTAGQRSMERRMTLTESDALAKQFTACPHTSFYKLISEFTGKERNITRADALYILTARGYLKGVAA